MAQQTEFFGKFVLLEKLASGGMAEVYLARSQGVADVAKFFAIKRILPKFSQESAFIEMFKEEAKIAINLDHQNVVSIIEFGEEKGQFFIVMEFVEGRNLREMLGKLQKANKRLSIEYISYVISQVAAGLDYAHRCKDRRIDRPLNIIHRDVSPQNVMLSFEGAVKIVDFGIAKAESRLESTQAGTLKGKYGYMSPEQVEGLELDYRTDIFSLGIVLWELLANERLFYANNELNTLRKIQDCDIKPLRRVDPNIPAELDRIALKALTKDRNYRYQSANELHRDLNKFLNQNFPDFSARDLGAVVQQLYLEERDELRKRMVEYAQMNLTKPQEIIQGKVNDEHSVTRTLADLADSILPSVSSKLVKEQKVTAPAVKETNPPPSVEKEKNSTPKNAEMKPLRGTVSATQDKEKQDKPKVTQKPPEPFFEAEKTETPGIVKTADNNEPPQVVLGEWNGKTETNLAQEPVEEKPSLYDGYSDPSFKFGLSQSEIKKVPPPTQKSNGKSTEPVAAEPAQKTTEPPKTTKVPATTGFVPAATPDIDVSRSVAMELSKEVVAGLGANKYYGAGRNDQLQAPTPLDIGTGDNETSPPENSATAQQVDNLYNRDDSQNNNSQHNGNQDPPPEKHISDTPSSVAVAKPISTAKIIKTTRDRGDGESVARSRPQYAETSYSTRPIESKNRNQALDAVLSLFAFTLVVGFLFTGSLVYFKSHPEQISSVEFAKPYIYKGFELVGWHIPEENTDPNGIGIPNNGTTVIGSVSPKIQVYVTSVPSGAEIFLNDHKTGKITPSFVELTQGAESRVMVFKSGSGIFSTTQSFSKNGSTFNANIDKALVGFVTVRLRLASDSTKVFINGTQFMQPDQLEAYPLKVGTYSIVAEDDFSRTRAEKKVQITPETTQAVDLVLQPRAEASTPQPAVKK